MLNIKELNIARQRVRHDMKWSLGVELSRFCLAKSKLNDQDITRLLGAGTRPYQFKGSYARTSLSFTTLRIGTTG
jgi:hypothetical protein